MPKICIQLAFPYTGLRDHIHLLTLIGPRLSYFYILKSGNVPLEKLFFNSTNVLNASEIILIETYLYEGFRVATFKFPIVVEKYEYETTMVIPHTRKIMLKMWYIQQSYDLTKFCNY